MNQRWTLHVENFARIKEADIEISPLMCFIADNNSGKSYMMSLLWGILVSSKVMLKKVDLSTTINKKCNKWIKKQLGQSFIVDNTIQQMYKEWFNCLINQNKEILVEHIFNQKINIDKIEIRNFCMMKDLKITLEQDEDNGYKYCIEFDNFVNVIKHHFNDDENGWLRVNFLIALNLLTNGITLGSYSNYIYGTTAYLPASRTSLLLTYPQISAGSIDDTFSTIPLNDWNNKLTRPYIRFLQYLTDLPYENKKFFIEENKNLIDFIEENMVNGNINIVNKGKEIHYKPIDLKQEIPLSITSSVVTEITPILLLLKILPLNLLIVEEPEAHLHPALQKK